MMKRFSFCLTVLAVWSCADRMSPCEAPIQDSSSDALYARMEDKEKVSIDDAAGMYWNAEDSISAFFSPENIKYIFDGATGDTEGSFSRAVAGASASESFSKIHALYPYRIDASCPKEGTIHTKVSDRQTFTPGSFDPEANIMVAVTSGTDDRTLSFKNVCGYLKVKMYGTDTVKEIRFKGNNGEILSGAAEISCGYEDEPSIELSGDSGAITLDCGEDGIVLPDNAEEAMDFWFVLPPMTFQKGFTLEIESTEGTVVTKGTSAEFSTVRNLIRKTKSMDVSANPEFLSFSVTDKDGKTYEAYDVAGPDITVCVPFGTDLTKLTANFTIRGQKVCIGDVEQESGVTVNDFSDYLSAAEYTVFGATGQSSTYYVKVIDTKLPVLYISTVDHTPVVDKVNWISSSSVFMETPGGERTNFGAVSIKGRGNTSWSKQDKKPYNIKFDKKQSLFGYPKHKKWCLMSCYGNSASFLRDDLMFEAARRTATLGWAPHGGHVDFVMNGKHLGLYWICEKIEVDKNRVNITELENDDVSEEKISGGYLMEFSSKDDLWFTSSEYGYVYNIKSPEDDVPDVQLNHIKNYIATMEASLKDDVRFQAREYADYIDVDSWIDYWFMHEIAGGTDITLAKYPGTSCFCHKERDGKLKAGPVWDMHMHSLSKDSFRADTCLYYRRMFEDPQFARRANEKWYGMNGEIGMMERLDGITNRSDSIYALIKESAARDLMMWNQDGTVEKQLSDVKYYFQHNSQQIDAHVRDKMPAE